MPPLTLTGSWRVVNHVFQTCIDGSVAHDDNEALGSIFALANSFMQLADTPLYWISVVDKMILSGVIAKDLTRHAVTLPLPKLRYCVVVRAQPEPLLEALALQANGEIGIRTEFVATVEDALRFIGDDWADFLDHPLLPFDC